MRALPPRACTLLLLGSFALFGAPSPATGQAAPPTSEPSAADEIAPVMPEAPATDAPSSDAPPDGSGGDEPTGDEGAGDEAAGDEASGAGPTVRTGIVGQVLDAVTGESMI